MNAPAGETKFDLLAVPLTAEGLQTVAGLMADVELQARIEEVADALTAGAPAVSLDLIARFATDLTPRSPSSSSLEPRPLLYWAAVSARLRRPDFGQLMAELDQRRGQDEADAGPGWGDGDEGQLYLQSLASQLVALAGLDLAATVDYARLYIENFPPFSRPLGDVDERAATWMAQLLDVGLIRATLRRLLAGLAQTWAGDYPRAAAQVRSWAEASIPTNPTRDGPWMRALLALARTQLE